jgi:hypothetical protein
MNTRILSAAIAAAEDQLLICEGKVIEAKRRLQSEELNLRLADLEAAEKGGVK